MSSSLGLKRLFCRALMCVMIVEPKTNSLFHDSLSIPIYPNANKFHQQLLHCFSNMLTNDDNNERNGIYSRFTKAIGINESKEMISIAVAHYCSENIDTYRLRLISNEKIDGLQIISILLPFMNDFSQSQYNIDIQGTRTGSLFFAALLNVKFNEDMNEITIMCEYENKSVSILSVDANENVEYLFTIQSDLLLECIKYTFEEKGNINYTSVI